jgi:hypothetical protein
MSYAATVFNVMIVSPSDVAAERATVREMIVEWNIVNAQQRSVVLLPIGWETHSSPATGKPPEKIINEQVLRKADLAVGIFWTRLGTPTDDYESGSVEEIEEHVKAGRPAMLYFSTAPVRMDSVDQTQWEALRQFKESWRRRGLYEEYDGVAGLREKFSRQLQLKVNQDQYFTSHVGDTEVLPPGRGHVSLSKEAQSLLRAASESRHGMINRIMSLGRPIISANGIGFVDENDARSIATWEEALQELERANLVEAVNFNRDGFRITLRGYEIAGAIAS